MPTDELGDERTRAIERGSKIVTIMPSTHTVVLQAPRGNLETISPRALVLASVRQSIEKKEFRAAFLTCRTHRIDMNILHSHEPELFMANVPLFIQQLEDVDYIDLFLSSLRYTFPLATLKQGVLNQLRRKQRMATNNHDISRMQSKDLTRKQIG
jgi:elongator complex protein 1